jgi:hypothetical protein
MSEGSLPSIFQLKVEGNPKAVEVLCWKPQNTRSRTKYGRARKCGGENFQLILERVRFPPRYIAPPLTTTYQWIAEHVCYFILFGGFKNRIKLMNNPKADVPQFNELDHVVYLIVYSVSA